MLFTVSNIDVLQGVIETMNLVEKCVKLLHNDGFSKNEYNN